jgi:hypothetical protein
MIVHAQLGRIATPKHRLATVPRLADHMSLPTTLIADSVDYAKRMTDPWGMLGNDRYGCCVIAAKNHFRQCASVNATGKAVVVTEAETLAEYGAITGFDPDDPSTDNGTVPLDALKYFLAKGEIIAYGRVDPTNDAHVAAAIELFGGLYTGWDLPAAWQSREVWDAGPNTSGAWTPGSWGGHMMSQTGYDAKCMTPTVTWGEIVNITAAARHVYCSEAYALITREWFDAHGKTIQGFDLASLQTQLTLVR